MKKIITAALVAVLGAVGNAGAVVVGFDADPAFHFSSGPYQESGFQIANSNNGSSALLFWGTQSFNADPGGNTLSHNFGGTTMTLSRISGGTFSFNSIDLADVYNNGGGGDVLFSFLFADNTSSQATVSVDRLPGLETFEFDLTNLTQVAWTPQTTQGRYLQSDNIRLDEATGQSVPEPGSLGMLALGLFALGAQAGRARRRA